MKLFQVGITLLILVSNVFAVDSVQDIERKANYYAELQKINFEDVKQDILEMLTDSKDFFPADYGHYGPFLVRMAWHCAGTIRVTDGEGGCEGGRQRFEPERSWGDNTNLDKAHRLLEPIKVKYGAGLSWGDLFIYTGTVALESMGVPTIGFCAGRVDDVDGSASLIFGPGEAQDQLTPCPVDGNCTGPVGASLLEHIYVDPNGFMKNPDPKASAPIMKTIFGRMGLNETETVALIAGGHTFGKTHGACPGGAGAPPREDPENPWPFPNQCGAENKPSNKVTSGFEGPWNRFPLEWRNTFFNALLTRDWELIQSPAGNNQFGVTNAASPLGPSADDSLEDTLAQTNPTEPIMMLITDMTLRDDESYNSISQEFFADFPKFTHHFSHVWYKLTSRDMGPASRCFGDDVPPPQEFQGPLPEPFEAFPNVNSVARVTNDVKEIAFTGGDRLNGKPDNTALLVEAAYLCASTYRVTDHFGGCNGARILQEPEASWDDRAPLGNILNLLRQNIESSNLDVSKADFIVFSATKVLQEATQEKDAVTFTFCPLRSDSQDEHQHVSEILQLQTYDSKIIQLKRHVRLMDITVLEYVALQGRPRSPSYMTSLGYQGTYTDAFTTLTNSHAKTLLENTWTRTGFSGIFGDEFSNEGNTAFITFFDFVLTLDDEFHNALVELAADEALFLSTFEAAWTKLMNADRYDGPVENLCTNGKVDVISIGPVNVVPPVEGGDDSSETERGVAIALFFGSLSGIFLMSMVVFFKYFKKGVKQAKRESEGIKHSGEVVTATL